MTTVHRRFAHSIQSTRQRQDRNDPESRISDGISVQIAGTCPSSTGDIISKERERGEGERGEAILAHKRNIADTKPEERGRGRKRRRRGKRQKWINVRKVKRLKERIIFSAESFFLLHIFVNSSVPPLNFCSVPIIIVVFPTETQFQVQKMAANIGTITDAKQHPYQIDHRLLFGFVTPDGAIFTFYDVLRCSTMFHVVPRGSMRYLQILKDSRGILCDSLGTIWDHSKLLEFISHDKTSKQSFNNPQRIIQHR